MKHLLNFVILNFVILFLLAPISSNAEVPGSFADIVEDLTPAVVNISTTKKIKQRSPFGRGGGSPFEQFPPGHPFAPFNDFFDQFKGPGGDRERKTTSLGSGFFISADGYLVTNNHVVEGADEILITYNADKEVKAEIIGTDKKTDLALLKTIKNEGPFPFVEFGDSDNSRIGDWVVVVGNPFGLGGTVTAGIVSAIGRDINAGPFDDFIQTDAAINSGNSGGPMFNVDGKVIGINTAIFSPNGVGNVGIGFAVPSSLAQPIIKQLKESGHIDRGWLGVRIQTVTEEIADSLGLEKAEGALVAEVMDDSPAQNGGIKTGDVILSFDGKEISTMKKLPRVVAETPAGSKVEVEVLRDGSHKTLNVTINAMEDESDELASDDEQGDDDISGSKTEKLLGMYLEPLTKDLRKRYGIDKDVEGLLILKVDGASSAAERGVRRGDVLVEVNQQVVDSVKDAKRLIKKAKSSKRSAVLLLLSRNNDTMFLALPIAEK